MSEEGSFFVDTNVPLYCISSGEPDKQQAAMAWLDWLWQTQAGRISWQVIYEYYANAPKKTGKEEARGFADQLVLWDPIGPSADLLHRAWYWCDAAHIDFWDAMILAAAEQSGCRYLLSEDFQEGRNFDGVTVINPFNRSPDSL